MIPVTIQDFVDQFVECRVQAYVGFRAHLRPLYEVARYLVCIPEDLVLKKKKKKITREKG